MDVVSFRAALGAAQPQDRLSPPLQALWWTAKGDWNKAHEIVQAHEDDRSCAWVHAHLHRVEGDLSNARYWYGRAQRPAATMPLEREWEMIVEELLRQDRTDGDPAGAAEA